MIKLIKNYSTLKKSKIKQAEKYKRETDSLWLSQQRF